MNQLHKLLGLVLQVFSRLTISLCQLHKKYISVSENLRRRISPNLFLVSETRRHLNFIKSSPDVGVSSTTMNQYSHKNTDIIFRFLQTPQVSAHSILGYF